MISPGDAAWPERETTYFTLSEPEESAVDDGGRVDGSGLYVYGRVVAVGSEMKGETVRGIWASSGWDPSRRSVEECLLEKGKGLTDVIHGQRPPRYLLVEIPRPHIAANVAGSPTEKHNVSNGRDAVNSL